MGRLSSRWGIIFFKGVTSRGWTRCLGDRFKSIEAMNAFCEHESNKSCDPAQGAASPVWRLDPSASGAGTHSNRDANPMNSHAIPLVAAALGLLVPACNAAHRAPLPAPATTCYASPDGERVRSTLVVTPGRDGEQMLGVTEIRTHGQVEQAALAGLHIVKNDETGVVRAVEKAELDESGHLVRLEATIAGGSGLVDTRVVLDPPSRRVEITTPSLHAVWQVPDDLPWVWVPLLTAPGREGPIATPLAGRVALLAAAGGHAVRRLDLATMTSHPMTSDQVVVPEKDGATVVVGDDAVDARGGRVTKIHLAALGTNLEPVDPVPLAYAQGQALVCPREVRQ